MVIEYKIIIENGTLTITQRVDLNGDTRVQQTPAEAPAPTLPNTRPPQANAAAPVVIHPAAGGDDEPVPPPAPAGNIPIGDGRVLVFGPVIFDLGGLIKKQTGQ